ncbi:GNAT family N-acetyltransferase [Streptomyces macrosporus]|uniref:N-acetyltransferase domain-containing protein n=1 Tax=Streptomyces macrosporus TaxID=44032 RepID=A0ABN3K4R5_9ACTN
MDTDALVIRRATDHDAPAVAEVWLRSRAAALPGVRRAHTDRQVREWVRDVGVPVHETWVATVDGVVVGMMALDGGEVEQLHLDPSWRGRGIGDRLVALAKRRSPDGLALWTSRGDGPARRFCERHGFRAVEHADADADGGGHGGGHGGDEEREPGVRYVWTPGAVGRASGAVGVRTLTADDWRLWREVRLAALAEAPYAFGSRLADWQGPGDREERWRARLSIPGAYHVVVELDGEPAGMVGGVPEPGRDEAELVSLWVAPDARGRGVGDRLVREVERWAVRAGAGLLRLAVVPGNEHAVGLYRRHGFVDEGPVGDALPDGRREHVMVKPLPTGRAPPAEPTGRVRAGGAEPLSPGRARRTPSARDG